jgi:exodeoxyribonuclease VII small subunit
MSDQFTEKTTAENNDAEAVTFEAAMEQLEKIVQRLEEGDVPLEQAINLYQEGIQLSKLCNEKLQNVEKKMDQVMDQNGQVEPLNIQEDQS